MKLMDVLFLIISMICANIVHCQDVNIAALFPAIMEEERRAMQEPCDDHSQQQEYDFIVVGAGTAGCVVASRLTEENDWDVLLLEAGGEETPVMDNPSLTSTLFSTDINWKYKIDGHQSQYKMFQNQKPGYLSGRVMGGGSTINAMIATRGTKLDYDNMAELGNPGWSYDDALYYFKKGERMEIPDLINSTYHSTNGNIPINYSPYIGSFSSVILEAGEEMGYQKVDYNGENSTGFSITQHTMKDGIRWSSSRGYLHAIRHRKNLHVKKRALVRRVLIDEATKKAYGVEFTKEDKKFTVFARKEIILSGGAIKSPQLLMLSGVGPREHLEKFGIPVIQDSKVGYNLKDHGIFSGLIFIMNTSFPKEDEGFSLDNIYDYVVLRKGPPSQSMNIAMLSLLEVGEVASQKTGYPNSEALWLYPPFLKDENSAVLNGIEVDIAHEYFGPLRDVSFYQVFSCPIRPRSRGRISLQANDIEISPLIDTNIYSDDEDFKIAISGIRKIIEITESKALQKIGSKLYDKPLPPCKQHEFGSDEYWRCSLLQFSFPGLHVSGTCKMGPASDESAVVSPELKVHGVTGLRVVDTSIYPEMPASHTMMPAYLAGEKGADLIKQDYVK